MLPEFVEKARLGAGVSLLADKGYSSQKSSAFLIRHNLVNGIMFKASKSKPLSETQKSFNSIVSKTRCLIERTFGSIRLWFSGGRCRYRDLEKPHTQNILEAMAYNKKRMPRLLMEQSLK